MIDAVLRARMESSRLPRKAVAEAAGKTMVEHCVERIASAATIDKVVVAITTEPADDELEALCGHIGVDCFRGSTDDVLGRVVKCAEQHGMEHVAHFGADNPLIDPRLIDLVAAVYADGDHDYVTNNRQPTFPDGEEVEITSMQLLQTIDREAKTPRHREHILLWAWENPERVRMRNVERTPSQHHERWTLDHPEDLEVVTAILEALRPGFSIDDAIAFLDSRPELRELNAQYRDDYAWLEA